ncbi:FecR family protein [Longitalea luteola]|uniref:FecR family protein n=1 Tax=Longitalea luteola TaxID=2812563 RepID=UPI001A95B004|nr:FecR family protein [Longitalea luteola]
MDLKQLLEDYRNGRLTAEQKQAFEQLLHNKESEELLQQLLDESLERTVAVEAEETQKFIYQRIRDQHIKEDNRKSGSLVSILSKTWLRYAAAIILMLGAGAYFLLNKKNDKTAVAVKEQQPSEDIAPGHEGAVLTLADGTMVDLDTLHNGIIARQNGAQVVLKDGLVTYDPAGLSNRETTYNTISTPKGRQFRIVLPDGSGVWLNAASSIKYPTVFTGDERRVEIDGEAYFEVKKVKLPSGKKMPFRVKIDDATEVEVLGTSFNINSYDDEGSIKTTLLEGSVRIVHRQSAVDNVNQLILKPGQQAIAHSPLTIDHSPLTIHHSPDVDQVMAWKNGLFNFNGYDLKTVMRELGRWYDLDIVYEGEPEPVEVMGEIQRNLSLSQVMKILQRIHINYRVEGRKLIIMK